MKQYRILILLIALLLSLTGCKSSSSKNGAVSVGTDPGGMTFNFDLGSLLAKATKFQGAPAATPTITAVKATLTRSGYTAINADLSVVNNTASGQVNDLAPGYWHVKVDVFDNQTMIFTGSRDVNVIAGAVTHCTILFDPVTTTPPPAGGIDVTVGLNPMPGYMPVDQAVSEVLFDEARAKLYILDAPALLIGIYEADTFIRTRDLVLPDAPLSIALDSTGTGIYLGFTSGHIRRLDIATGNITLVADILMQVDKMVTLNSNFLMASGPGSWDTDLKVVNVGNGQIVSTKSLFYTLTDLVYNPIAKTVYSHHTGVSPTDIHYIRVDDATGAIGADGDSIYHGDHAMGTPLRFINDNTRLAASSGNMFSSSELTGDDLRYSGSLGFAYADLSADNARAKLYLLNSSGIRKLLVMDDNSYFTDLTVDLAGAPARVLNTTASIIVLSEKDAKYYAKVFAKDDLLTGVQPVSEGRVLTSATPTGPYVIKNDATGSGYLSLAMGSRGDALITWRHNSVNGEKIHACYSPWDDGWGVVTALTDDYNYSLGHSESINEKGEAFVVQQDHDGIFYNIGASHFDPAAGWSAPALAESNEGNAKEAQVAAGPHGNAFAVWRVYYSGTVVSGEVWVNEYDAIAGWKTPQRLSQVSGGSALFPTIAVDRSGNALAVWIELSNIAVYTVVAKAYTPEGGWDSSPTILSHPGYPFNPHIAFDGAGNAITAWGYSKTAYHGIETNRYTTGTGWGTTEKIVEQPNAITYIMYPALAVTPGGDAVVVWMQNAASKYQVWTDRYIAGSGWAKSPVLLSDPEDVGSAQDPRVAVAPSGNAVAVWRQYYQYVDPADSTKVITKNNIAAAEYFPTSGWGAARIISQDKDKVNSDYPGVAMDSNGNALAVWQEWDATSGLAIWGNWVNHH